MLNENQNINQESKANTNQHQKFTIFCGTYEGAILGLGGDLTNLTLKYAFKPSTNSLKSMDITNKYLIVGGFDEYLRIYDLKRQRECGILEGHTGTITSLKCHKSIAFSSGEDGFIMVWKMKEFALLHRLKEHKSQVNDIAVHESGKILVSISKDQKLFIWNLLNGTKAYSMNLKYNAYRVEINNEYILTMSDQALYVIDQQTNKQLFQLKQEDPVTINDFCVYNNKYVLIGEFNEITQNQELKDVKPIYKVETLNRLNCLAIYMDLVPEKSSKIIIIEKRVTFQE
ncbi:pak1 interacting protein 1, putative [Ichthyophthirius multifiliis]|uniref:Pak1 interacting protein 1, putative n=1 Tax=Ichthyophthirius multifiliis TaxID=5932 RepID=G0QNI6_ICHMU|nr:pak1 interacting protein 1, putative [Ichthyophthirius multifiliis]EGR33220.1 pak1 interacting protein 1, putative [Ichthyophthirius multifiliis]|eukprot:XP_004037206.1 pak1 interacting protein 1, putative [Ichthyophthirius multifiliis]